MPQELDSAMGNLMAYIPTQMTKPASTCVLVATPTWGSVELDLSLMTTANAVTGLEPGAEALCITSGANIIY